MADLSFLINIIKKNIQNNTEGRITGNILQNQLIQIVNTINNTKIDVDSEIPALDTTDKTIVGAINEINRKNGRDIVTVGPLPETGVPSMIYVVPKTESTSTDNNYDEYMWINNRWEIVGNDLTTEDFANEPITTDEIKSMTNL